VGGSDQQAAAERNQSSHRKSQEQAAQTQKVSAQVEVSKPAPQNVANNQ